MSLLELENVVTAYGKVEALKGLTLRVEQGEIVALLGSNGAGKSTTLRTISGLVRPLSGTMRFLGQPIDRLSPEAIVKLGVAHVPEGRRVFPGLTVRENILLGGSSRRGVRRAALETDTDRMFGIFPEIKPFENVLSWTLSGGQLQMVAIARGLMARPKVLLLAGRASWEAGRRHQPGTATAVIGAPAWVLLSSGFRGLPVPLSTGRPVYRRSPTRESASGISR